MARIEFIRHYQKVTFHNPLKGGECDVQEIEVRVDPLIGHQSVLNPGLEGKLTAMFPETDAEYLRERAEETEPQCFLCMERWKTMTPTYPEDLIKGGRLRRGGAVLFPNLFPLAAQHAMVMLGDRHFLPLGEIPVSLLEDGLSASVEFARLAYAADPSVKYFTISANFLFPAGASIMHPHIQVLGSPFPWTHQQILLDKSREYKRSRGSIYWQDLVDTEWDMGERSIARLGSGYWLMAFSPMGSNEVNAVWPDCESFLSWTSRHIEDLAKGIVCSLKGYAAKKFSTFNFSIYSGPPDGSAPDLRCLMRLINRQNATRHYRTDDLYFQKLLRNEIILDRPESMASFMRSFFHGGEASQ